MCEPTINYSEIALRRFLLTSKLNHNYWNSSECNNDNDDDDDTSKQFLALDLFLFSLCRPKTLSERFKRKCKSCKCERFLSKICL